MIEEEKKVLEIEEALEVERETYSEKIKSAIKMINNIESISESQVLMLSYRHMLVEKVAKYKSILYKKKSSDLNFRKSRYEYYKTQHDIRLDYREINEFISSDMALRIRQSELIENQISFYNQCIDTLDKMGFAIKAKIQVEELNYKNGIVI